MRTSEATEENRVRVYQTPSGWYAQGTYGSAYDTCRFHFVMKAPSYAFWTDDEEIDRCLEEGLLEEIEGCFL